MQRGLYISGTGMMVQRRLMETVTNNITNVETTGYKKNYLVTHSFDDVLLERINDLPVVGVGRYAGPLTFGTLVDQIYQDFSQGNLEASNLNTDLALVGDAFFVIDTPGGERYTRSGAFALTVDGYLCDANGNYLLGERGRLRVGTDQFAVSGDGTVAVDGEYLDTLRLVRFEDNTSLRSEGGNLFSSTAGPVAAVNFEVKQGFVENSNVQTAREMVDMLTVYRAYETNQKILTMIDETLGMAVKEIGGLR